MTRGVFHNTHLGGALRRIGRQEALGDPIVSLVGEFDPRATEHALIVGVRDPQQDARTVTGARIAPGCAAVRQAPKEFDAHGNDLVTGWAAKIGDKTESACVMFE
jgi:hypothetical protein